MGISFDVLKVTFRRVRKGGILTLEIADRGDAAVLENEAYYDRRRRIQK